MIDYRALRADAAAALGFPTIGPILPHLLTWLQDGNWPVSRPVERVLAGIGEPLVDPIRAVLRSTDDVWKYWVLARLVKDSPGLRAALDGELRRLAAAPSRGEREEAVDQVAREILR